MTLRLKFSYQVGRSRQGVSFPTARLTVAEHRGGEAVHPHVDKSKQKLVSVGALAGPSEFLFHGGLQNIL